MDRQSQAVGNEVFTTHAVGLMDGPITQWEIVKAVLGLRRADTDNLRIRLAGDITLADGTYRKANTSTPASTWSPARTPQATGAGGRRVITGIFSDFHVDGIRAGPVSCVQE